MRVLIVRHHDVDTAGFISDAFEARGAVLDMHLLPDDGPLPAPDAWDYIVVLGANPSVNDDLPWIAGEVAWLRAARVPVLGICFGAQALCAMAGGRVEQAPRKEIGWTMIDSSVPDQISPGPWMEFHGDRCLLPEGAEVLAVNELCVQAFTIGQHPGVDGREALRQPGQQGAELHQVVQVRGGFAVVEPIVGFPRRVERLVQ